MYKWFLKIRATPEVRDEAPENRIPDDVLAKRIEAQLSAARIRAAVEAEFSGPKIPDVDPLENTFDVPLEDGNDLVFIPDGSNIEVKELDDLGEIEYDPTVTVDFGREVDEVTTAWGTLSLREEAVFKKDLKASKK